MLRCDLRNREIKGRTLVWFRLHPNSSALPLDHCLADCQTNPASFVLIRTVKALEQTEDFIGVLHVDPDAVVRHLEDPLRSVVCRADMNFRLSIAAILDGVRDEVGKDLGPTILVRLNNGQRIEGYNGTL